MNKYFGVLTLIIMIAALIALCNLAPVAAGDSAPTVTPPPNTPRVTPVSGYPPPATVTPPSNYPGPVYDPGVDFTYLPFIEAGR